MADVGVSAVRWAPSVSANCSQRRTQTAKSSLVVENVRIRISGLRKPAPWAITRKTLYPRDCADHAFPVGFPIPGRAAITCFAEFMLHRPERTLEAGQSYPVEVDALVRGDRRTVSAFRLNVPPTASDLRSFLPYSNDPEVMMALGDPAP